MKMKEVANNAGNRKLFRQVARDTSGATFEPPAEEKILFCYVSDVLGQEKLVGVASYRLADRQDEKPDVQFCCGYYHVVSYMFVKSYHQRDGCGSTMLRQMIVSMLQYVRRPVRLESAHSAVSFFIKNGFNKTDDTPIECVSSGSRLFSTLYRMELMPPIPGCPTAKKKKPKQKHSRKVQLHT